MYNSIYDKTKGALKMCVKPAEYMDAKEDQPGILQTLGEYIELNCTHGAKKPIAHLKPGESTPVMYCCLKCAVAYIMREKTRSKITCRT
jgi:hypothetical protein